MNQGTLHILLITPSEQEFSHVHSIVNAMPTQPANLSWAPSNTAARQTILTQHVDLVLLEQPPDAPSALDILQLIGEMSDHQPVIVLATISDPAVERYTIESGAAGYVIKDQLTPANLERTVQHTVLRHKTSQIPQEQVTRAEARVRSAQQRLAFLTYASEALNTSLTTADTLRAIVTIAIPRLAEFGAVIARTHSGSYQGASALALSPSSPQAIPAIAEFTLPHLPLILHSQITSRQVLRWNIPDNEVLTSLIPDTIQRLTLAARIPHDAVALPLVVRNQTIGSLILININSTAHQSSSPAKLSLDLAHHAAIALENARLYTEAQEAIRIRDEFLSVAAHELRTPIATLRGFVQLALRQLNRRGSLDPGREHQILTEIEDQTTKLTTLVDQLLDVSRLEARRLSIEPENTDLAQIVQNAAEAARLRSTPHQITCTMPPCVPAFVDPIRIEQVITNLLDNAIKYSPQGGDIAITLHQPTSSSAQIIVSDHGTGIAPEHLGHIFDRFYQAHDGGNFWGLGLGLYISRQIAQHHGGTLTVTSDLGKGSTFRLTLPTHAYQR